MQRAKSLLQDPATTINVVAVTVGYRSAGAFIAAFKRETGHPPSAYRRGSVTGAFT
jgi:AraC-like DNA-binding protein